MGKPTVAIKILKEDADILNKEWEEDYLKHHPDMKDINLTFAYKIRKLIEFWFKHD